MIKRRYIYLNVLLISLALLLPAILLDFGNYKHGSYKKIDQNESYVSDYEELFPSVNEIDTFLRKFSREFSRFATLYEIGRSGGNSEPIYNMAVSSGFAKPIVVFIGGIYGSDLASPLILMHFMSDLVTRETDLSRFITLFDYHFLFLTNPDGYKYVFDRDYLSKSATSKNATVIKHPSIPFATKIKDGLHVGKIIEIMATPLDSQSKEEDESFCVYLQYYTHEVINPVGLHFAVTDRWRAAYVNAYADRNWTARVRVAQAHFEVGVPFAMRIECEQREFRVFLNDAFVASVDYLLPIAELRHFGVKGDVRVDFIRFFRSNNQIRWLKNVNGEDVRNSANIFRNFDNDFAKISKSSDFYGGENAFSEQEAQILRDYFSKIRGKMAAAILLFSSEKKETAISYPEQFVKNDLWVPSEYVISETLRKNGYGDDFKISSASKMDEYLGGRLDEWIALIFGKIGVYNVHADYEIKKDGSKMSLEKTIRQVTTILKGLIHEIYFNEYSTFIPKSVGGFSYNFEWKEV